MSDHSQDVVDALSKLDASEKAILNSGLRLMRAADGATYVFDLFAIGALNRAAAMTSGFRKLISDRNMITAGALIRMHLDTAFRFYASYLVENRDAFATAVLNGDEIRNLRDRNGKRMFDHYLVRQLDSEFAGVHRVYDKACAYVHMSHTHLQSALDGADRANQIVHIQISATDRALPDSFYIDACGTFCTITEILLQLVEGWISFKTENAPECVS